jgi:hypothetical protein
MNERHRCRSCDCCYSDLDNPYICAGCYLTRGNVADCDTCSKHTLLYEPGRDGHRVKEVILADEEVDK